MKYDYDFLKKITQITHFGVSRLLLVFPIDKSLSCPISPLVIHKCEKNFVGEIAINRTIGYNMRYKAALKNELLTRIWNTFMVCINQTDISIESKLELFGKTLKRAIEFA